MQIKSLIEQWIKEAIGEPNVNQVPVLFHIDGNSLFIISPISAYLVGPNGALISKYEQMLKQFGFRYYIKLIDLVPGKVEEVKI